MKMFQWLLQSAEMVLLANLSRYLGNFHLLQVTAKLLEIYHFVCNPSLMLQFVKIEGISCMPSMLVNTAEFIEAFAMQNLVH